LIEATKSLANREASTYEPILVTGVLAARRRASEIHVADAQHRARRAEMCGHVANPVPVMLLGPIVDQYPCR